jgi:hypothetical protein
VPSSFVIKEVDHTNRVVILTDHEFGLRIKTPFGKKSVKDESITNPYSVRFTYNDGMYEVKRILE